MVACLSMLYISELEFSGNKFLYYPTPLPITAFLYCVLSLAAKPPAL